MASNAIAIPFVVTQEEVNLFHAIDRELYTILAILLCRDPVESMQVMALWLWLEREGFRNVVKRMLSLPLILINELADETVTCLNCINGTLFSFLSESHDIPLLQAFMAEEISIQFFHENRQRAAEGVTKAGNTVCIKALGDIIIQAIQRNIAHQNSTPANQSQVMLSPPNIRHQPPVPPPDRTMFLTFSKGYPVHEFEVRHFFTRAYGDCIESLQMQEVQPCEQALFARVVFYSATTIEAILNGMSKAKFTINGKHVWVRKFVARRTSSSMLPPMMWPHNLPVSSIS